MPSVWCIISDLDSYINIIIVITGCILKNHFLEKEFIFPSTVQYLFTHLVWYVNQLDLVAFSNLYFDYLTFPHKWQIALLLFIPLLVRLFIFKSVGNLKNTTFLVILQDKIFSLFVLFFNLKNSLLIAKPLQMFPCVHVCCSTFVHDFVYLCYSRLWRVYVIELMDYLVGVLLFT